MLLVLYKKAWLKMAIFTKVVKIVAAPTNFSEFDSLIVLKFMSFNFGNYIFTVLNKSKISSQEMGLRWTMVSYFIK